MTKYLITALATPFLNGKIDCYSYERLLAKQIEANVNALLTCSTTGESTLLDCTEKKLLVTVTKAVSRNTPIIAGVGGFSTKEAVKSACSMAKLGVDALLVAPPPFSKCTEKGYIQHISAVKNCSRLPVILYNVPSRCGYFLSLEAIEYLASIGVTCVKEASNDLSYAKRLTAADVLSGNDSLLAEHLKIGAKGSVSVVSNVAPVLTRKMLDGKNADGFDRLAELSMQEVSPIGIKYMLYKAGVFSSFEMRLPLTAASDETRRNIDDFWNGEIN